MVLVDSSVWIATVGVGFDDLLSGEEPAICPPIIQEVLQGARTEREFRGMQEIFRTMIVLDPRMSVELFEEAAKIFRLARYAGYTIRSKNDCLIAACALKHGVPVLHEDRDFTAIARVTMLEERRLTN